MQDPPSLVCLLGCLYMNTYTLDIDVISLQKSYSYGPAKSSSVHCSTCRVSKLPVGGGGGGAYPQTPLVGLPTEVRPPKM